MDLRYLYQLHCFADPDFYDVPERWDDGPSRFSLAQRKPPPGWARFEEGVWVSLHPRTVKLPWQGWKIHVSACLDNAEEVLGVVWDYCLVRRISFKFLRSRALLLITNSKYGDRTSSGKFCTLYPVGEAELERTLADLGTKLGGQRGPYILSDLRWSGPVYVRYGGFGRRYCMDETGELVLAVARPDGQLVPDLRQPGFEVPPWVEVPGFLAERIAAGRSEPPPDFPYEIEEALHFSNAGGVYLAQDRQSGRQVVLKEARPYAGLDNDGTDAVTRLERERSILEELGDTGVSPCLLDHFTCWEHHFLAEEYVEGEGLRRAVNARHPEAAGSGTEIADYTAWALDVGERIERAVEVLHGRGIVYGDLHPGNIVVRPDGRVAFIDLEIASHLAEHRRPGLGALGFTAPERCSGFDIDRYALACVRLWMFLTFAPALVSRALTKAETFVDVLTERFGVPDTFADQMLRDLRLGLDGDDRADSDAGSPYPVAGAGVLDSEPDWAAVRRSMAEGITASATPERPDRLFPGDVQGFRYGGLGLAYGAAGVLYALAATGAGTDPAHVDWLVRASRRGAQPYVGLYNGLHGVAYALDYLGRHDDAMNVLDRALSLTPDVPVRGLFGGLAGIGLNLLHFARLTGEGSLREAVLGIAERLTGAVRDSTTTPDLPAAAGLMYGFCGAALLFVHLYEDTADSTFLDLAAAAVRRDLALCHEGTDGSLQVAEGQRLMPYLAIGSAGISLVAGEYLRHRGDEDLDLARRRLLRACDAEYVLFPGLFTGRAGLMASLGLAGGGAGGVWADAARAHLHRLAWHALPYRGQVVFPGDQSFRLSMDLATGTAGVLLAMNTVVGHPDHGHAGSFLPFLGPRQPAVRPSPTGVPVALPGRAASAIGLVEITP